MLFVIAKLALWSRPSVVLRDFRMSVTRQMALLSDQIQRILMVQNRLYVHCLKLALLSTSPSRIYI